MYKNNNPFGHEFAADFFYALDSSPKTTPHNMRFASPVDIALAEKSKTVYKRENKRNIEKNKDI